jgi:hypothetical protein
MARSRTPVTKRKPRGKSKTTPPQKRKLMNDIPKQAMSVDQFCHAHNIGRDLFYELLHSGQGPACMLLKKRRLISFESAAEWRAKREAASTEKTEEVAA